MFLSKICQIFYDVSAHNGMYQFIELNSSGETFGRNETLTQRYFLMASEK